LDYLHNLLQNIILNIEEVYSISHFNDKIQRSSSVTTMNTLNNYQQQPLVEVEVYNIPKISNPEYHKPKGHPPK
jgi:hypothetical protein